MKRLIINFFIFSTTFATTINMPADSATIQVGVDGARFGDTDNDQLGTVGEPIEETYFDYLKALNYEQPKKYFLDSGRFLRKTVSSAEALASYKIEEYRAYLNAYFPDAHSDYIQRFMIETYINQKEWGEVLAGLLKFTYLYQNSNLNGPVIENGSKIIQQVKYYQSNRDKLLSLIQGKPETVEIHDSFYEFLTSLRSFNEPGIKSLFKREAWEYLRLYSDFPQASTVLIWLAEVELANGAHHSAFMIYTKLKTLYPASPDFATALYQTGKLQQERFSEFEKAIGNFRQLLEQFPDDSLVADAQYRIAVITDQNLHDWTIAVAEYEQLATQYPASIHTVPGLLRMGEIQAGKLKQKEEAVNTYNRIAAEYPGSIDQATEALQRAGKLYEKSKSYEKAIDQYMSVHNNYPQTEGALVNLEKCAKLYEKKLERNDKAREILNIIIMDFPETKSAKKAAKRLKKLNK